MPSTCSMRCFLPLQPPLRLPHTCSSSGCAADVPAARPAQPAGDSASSSSALDILSADAWPGVAEQDVLLQPHDIRTTWREFMSASNVQVQQVRARTWGRQCSRGAAAAGHRPAWQAAPPPGRCQRDCSAAHTPPLRRATEAAQHSKLCPCCTRRRCPRSRRPAWQG